jgi:hypothetical protein
MANLLKPSLDQIVFSNSQNAQPARGRPVQNHNVSFLAQDEAREPITKKLSGTVRAVATVTVLVAAFAFSGQI